MGMHLYNEQFESREGDGFDRLLMHYDAALQPLSRRAPLSVMEELEQAINALRAEGLQTEGPALSRFVDAWTSASRLVKSASLSRIPASLSIH